MRRVLSAVLILGCTSWTASAFAQKSLTGSTPVSYDFDTPLFDGSGFAPVPAAGQLDSDEWIVLGVSDGDLAFGATGVAGDYARGTDFDGVTTGGVYAFDTDNADATTDYGLGAQPGGSEFSPGSYQLRVTNGSAAALTAVHLAFDLHLLNNATRSSRVTVRLIRESDGAAITADAFQTDSVETADPAPLWTSSSLAATIDLSTIAIAAGANLIVSFDIDDLIGSGSRDEIAFDDVTLSIPTCGNGGPDAGEACDDGNVVTEMACPYGTATCLLCNADCSAELPLTGGVCGDSTTDSSGSEACDDGNTVSETGCAYGTATCLACSDDCLAELPLTGAFCGDGTTDASDGEVCDDGNTVTETACAYGMASCMACDAGCTLVLDLTGAVCGDSAIDTGDGEVCDDGNTTSETACAYGTATCLGCSGDCTSEPSLTGGVCGDGTTDAGDEACDDGNTVTEAECAYGMATCMACDDGCATVLALVGAVCGDGTTDTEDGEECDDTNTTSGDGCSEVCLLEVDGGVTEDAGMGDAGVIVDAGTVDAGPDAGEDDGGAEDAATPADAATDVDSGMPDGDDGGCSCSAPGVGGGTPPMGLLLLGLGLAVVVRRRRR